MAGSSSLRRHVCTVLGVTIALALVLLFTLTYNNGEHYGIDHRLVRTAPLPPYPHSNWTRILHFVPRNATSDCLTLFTTRTSRRIHVAPDTYPARALITREMRKYSKASLTPEHRKLTLAYQELARQEWVRTVCEIGFNVGQSAVVWLSVKPDLVLYAFDLGVLSGEMTAHMGRVLRHRYPARFNLILGDSRITVPQFAQLGTKCDIVSIDGGHDYPIVFPDLVNMRLLAAKKHIIVADDIYIPGVNKAWTELVNARFIHHLFDCRIKGLDIDFALGYYPDSHLNFTL